MNIKTELLKKHIVDYVKYHIEDFDIDADEIVNTTALKLLTEIHKIIHNEEYSDFDMIEKIIHLFEEYNINTEDCHDF